MENNKKAMKIIKIVLGVLLLLTIILRTFFWQNFSSIVKTEDYVTYESTNVDLSFEHPKSWFIREISPNPMVSDACFITSQTEPYWMCIMINEKVNDEAELTTYIESTIIKNITNSIITGRGLIEKDGEIWQRVTYDYELNRFIPFLHRNSSCYIDGISRPDGAYAVKFCSQKSALEEATPIFERIFESLKIGD